MKINALSLALSLWIAPIASDAIAATACPRFEVTLVQTAASASTRPVGWGRSNIQVDRAPIVSMNDVSEARWANVEPDEHTKLQLKFKPAAAERLQEITSNPAGIRLAVVLEDRALMNVFFQGGFGVGREGLQLSLGDEQDGAALFAAIDRCSGSIAR